MYEFLKVRKDLNIAKERDKDQHYNIVEKDSETCIMDRAQYAFYMPFPC